MKKIKKLFTVGTALFIGRILVSLPTAFSFALNIGLLVVSGSMCLIGFILAAVGWYAPIMRKHWKATKIKL